MSDKGDALMTDRRKRCLKEFSDTGLDEYATARP
jgi:hypothetical protein